MKKVTRKARASSRGLPASNKDRWALIKRGKRGRFVLYASGAFLKSNAARGPRGVTDESTLLFFSLGAAILGVDPCG